MPNPSAPRTVFITLATAFVTWAALGNVVAQQRRDDRIRLVSREFIPTPGIDSALKAVAQAPRHGLIQFQRIPTLPERNALRRVGVELLTYIPNRAFLARLPADIRPVLRLGYVRYVGPLQPNDKIEPRILKEGVNPFAKKPDGTLRLSVLFFKDVAISDATAVVLSRGGQITETVDAFHIIRADFPEKSLRQLLAEDKVQWVEDIFEEKMLNDGARANMRVDLVQAPPYGLDGTGAVIGEWDAGHAVDPANVALHPDLAGRVQYGELSISSSGGDPHATHVAGTAIGSGLLSASQGGTPFQWKGMAPNATLITYDWGFFLNEYPNAVLTHHIDLSTNSWHNGGNGFYTLNASTLDSTITGSLGKRIPILWAAGNQRDYNGANLCQQDLDANPNTRFDSYDCVVHLASAKNTITVGAINSDDDSMTNFSSWGPTDDGRLKPEIVAPGCQVTGDQVVTSTVPGGTYGVSCGTSMSTPAVAGCTALLLQRFRQLCPSSGVPLPSTLKALLIHGAVDLNDGTAWDTRGPDFASGYGRLDLPRSVDLVPFYLQDTAQSGVKSYSIMVAPQQDLKVTLVWDDPAAAPNAAITLINDLDLELVDPLNGIHQPWVLDPANPPLPATRGVDSRNVVEQVVVDNVPLALAGTWTIRVKGTNVPSLTQQFSLVSELLPSTSCTGPSVAADFWGADTPLDTGVQPNPDPGAMWISDDIRVRLAAADGPHENPEFGQTNYVFITVRNRGTQTGPYARVFLYWANGSTGLAWPTDWNQLGSATAVNVPAGGSTVVGPIQWNPAGTGHFCLYARMITHNEPIASESANVYANTQQSNQIIWKNVTVVNTFLKPYETTFILRNPHFKAATFNLGFEEPREQLRDPFLNKGQVFVDLGKPLYERWKRSGGKQRGLSPTGGTEFRMVDPRRAEILGLGTKAREEFTVRIRFSAKEKLPPGASYRVDVVQRPESGSKPVGGVSYRLEAGKPKQR